jgi:hypothetical protein
MKKITVITGVLLLVVLSNLGHADTMRCETGLVVSNGDSAADVLTKCGKPTQREKRQECHGLYTGRSRADCVTVDMWTYNFGPRRLLYSLIFKKGRLAAVQTHGYGR